MSMRKQFVNSVEECLVDNKELVVFLCDIGVYGFQNALEKYSERVFNIGILEQTTVSLAAGISKSGLIPIVHTIAPFLVERSFEQLKIDFGYQKLRGNFVSVGASYDYASLGCTHHCPGDVNLLKTIQGMEIIVPGTAREFNTLFRETYANNSPTYFRLSERENSNSNDVTFGKATVIKKGSKATVIAIGPVLDQVKAAVADLDVTLLYYTTVAPFDFETLKNNVSGNVRILLIEPFYSGSITHDILKAFYPKFVLFDNVSIPVEFLTNYGKAEEHDLALGITKENILGKLKVLINEEFY